MVCNLEIDPNKWFGEKPVGARGGLVNDFGSFGKFEKGMMKILTKCQNSFAKE